MINKIIHGCVYIWNFLSRVQLDISLVSYGVKHSKRNSIFTCAHVLFSISHLLIYETLGNPVTKQSYKGKILLCINLSRSSLPVSFHNIFVTRFTFVRSHGESGKVYHDTNKILENKIDFTRKQRGMKRSERNFLIEEMTRRACDLVVSKLHFLVTSRIKIFLVELATPKVGFFCRFYIYPAYYFYVLFSFFLCQQVYLTTYESMLRYCT